MSGLSDIAAREDGVRVHSRVPVKHFGLRLNSDARRSILLPFDMGKRETLSTILSYVKSLSDVEVTSLVRGVWEDFSSRHHRFQEVLEERCAAVRTMLGSTDGLSRKRLLLVGAYFTMEYSIEAAALFNPSIIASPSQEGLSRGAMRFIMSMRAVGEGHISTTVFKTGIIGPGRTIRVDPASGRSASPRVAPDALYYKDLMRRSLAGMAISTASAETVLGLLPDQFTLAQMDGATAEARKGREGDPGLEAAIGALEGLARANYGLTLGEGDTISDTVLFPRSAAESKGIEDMRLVRFTDDDRSVRYFGTYTGFNGTTILPMLMQTRDFRSFSFHTLNGACARNKGMALFPRRIGGHYAMCSRIDGKNLYIMFSDYEHFWESACLLAGPKYSWEARLIGNCGSALETSEGWLLLTHGVGPMRRYSLGAFLLDTSDPLRILGRLKEPLISPARMGREGYVPNVVYSCGSIIHKSWLYLPYAISDAYTRVAAIPVDRLIAQLKKDGP